MTLVLIVVGKQSTKKEDRMKQEFTVIIEQEEEGYFVAEVPELKGCHTQAKSLDTLMERIKEAIELCLEVYGQREFTHHLI